MSRSDRRQSIMQARSLEFDELFSFIEGRISCVYSEVLRFLAVSRISTEDSLLRFQLVIPSLHFYLIILFIAIFCH